MPGDEPALTRKPLAPRGRSFRRRKSGKIVRPASAAAVPLLLGSLGFIGHHSPPARTARAVQLASSVGPPANSPGAVAGFGSAVGLGGPGASLGKPVVGLAASPGVSGYWLVAGDGGIFSYGNAAFYGSLGDQHLNAPVVGIAATPTGHGYWLVGADGGVFPFGDAAFHGSLGGISLNKPIVAIAGTPTGAGYWMVGSDGGIFTFGDAPYLGSLGSEHLNRPVVAMAATASGRGYWLAAADGGLFNFGDAPFLGSLASEPDGTAVVGMSAAPDGAGYWMATAPSPPPAAATAEAALTAPTGRSLGTFLVTCYDLSGATASGVPVNNETVAVDPSVIPLGTRIDVDGAGARIAEDTGGAIVGHRLDIWEPTYAQCAAWGAEYRQVWLDG